MPGRWLVPILLALAAPSGFGGSATGAFGIEIQLQVAGASPPPPPSMSPPGGAPIQAGDRGPTTCSSASGAASVQVSCSTPTFVQISDGAAIASSSRGSRSSEDACGQFAAVPGLTCVSYAGHAIQPSANEGVSLLPADTALRLEEPGIPAGPGTLYEIRRRDSLSTLVAVQTVDPASRAVELLVTF